MCVRAGGELLLLREEREFQVGGASEPTSCQSHVHQVTRWLEAAAPAGPVFPVTPSTPIAPYHSQYPKSLPVLPVFTVTPSLPSHAHCSQCSQSLSVISSSHSQSLPTLPVLHGIPLGRCEQRRTSCRRPVAASPGPHDGWRPWQRDRKWRVGGGK